MKQKQKSLFHHFQMLLLYFDGTCSNKHLRVPASTEGVTTQNRSGGGSGGGRGGCVLCAAWSRLIRVRYYKLYLKQAISPIPDLKIY